MNRTYFTLLEEARKEKLKINRKTLQRTKKLYEKAVIDLENKVKNAKNYNERWIKGQIEYYRKEIKILDKTLETMVREGIESTSLLMSSVNGDFFSKINDKYKLGLDSTLIEALYGVNTNVINKIITGNLYKDKRSLSERIWKYSEKNIEDVQDILLQGMIQKKPLKEICKELEAYCGKGNTKVPIIKKTYGNLNSNALRMIRTSLNHSFIETMKDECKYNPFVEGYKWTLSPEHGSRMKGGDICDDYASHEEGLGEGVFRKNNLPVPHCNCLCIVTPHISDSMEDIGSRLRKWVDGGKDIEIDRWVEKTYKIDR